jgi:hypothetical protein
MARRKGSNGSSRPKASATDRHARTYAKSIAGGRPFRISDDVERYFHESPREIFAALDGAASNMPPTGSDETLAFGYLFVLQGLLQELRYRMDRGYHDAIALVAEFQATVAQRVRDDELDGRVLSFTASALQQAGIEAAPDLVAASTAAAESDIGMLRLADLAAAIADMVEACGNDPFELVAASATAGHAMPPEVRGTMVATLAASELAVARSAAVLFLLDPRPEVRHAVARALQRVSASVSQIDVRRLIAMRNWRPEQERAALDAIVRDARAAGVDCARWAAAGDVEAILASSIDGSTSQGLLMVSSIGRQARLSSILTKNGVADAFIGEPEPRRRVEDVVARAVLETAMLPVSRGYLDGVVEHHLALLVAQGKTPPVGLLQVAESIGGAAWQPSASDPDKVLAELWADIPESMREATSVRAILRNSGLLPILETIADSWFEDDVEAAQIVGERRTGPQSKRVEHVLNGLVARRRPKWVDLVLRTAVWLRDADASGELPWRELAIVAKALADGIDLGEIGLMREVALRTVDVLGTRTT